MNRFRKICRVLHRELGYLVAGLVVIYALSGLAMNHRHHWDPAFAEARETLTIEAPGTGPMSEVQPLVLERLGITEPVKNIWRASEEDLEIYLEKSQYEVNLATGEVVHSGPRRRPVLFDLIFMHRNNGHGLWTVIGDVFGVAMILLATSGIFLVKGGKGLAGRGGVLLAVSLLVPLIYSLLANKTD